MEDLERHEMQLDRIHPSGAEEWHCPTCGRRFLMRWPPSYSKIVLEPGDELAIHSGGKGGLQMGRAQVSADEMLLGALPADDVTRMEFLGDLAGDAQADEPDIELSDSLLEPWRRFLDASDS